MPTPATADARANRAAEQTPAEFLYGRVPARDRMTQIEDVTRSMGDEPGELARRDGCPKRMVFGPCGGLRVGGRCEIDERPCPFITAAAPHWHEAAEVGPVPLSSEAGRVPLIITDFRPAEPTFASARALARRYDGWSDAVLLGDHHDRVDLPNVTLAAITLDEGCAPWVTLSCRDRNRVALEADLAVYAQMGVAGVHCVTGDACAPHIRPESTPVFDLDSVRLTAVARTFGLTVSVAESPLVEPTDQRPLRTADKHRAGASWCFINLGTDAEHMALFISAARRCGAALRFAACVAVFTDRDSAQRLGRLPGVTLTADDTANVVGSPDPVAAGIDHAVTQAHAFLAVDGVEAINLSGPASAASAVDGVAVMQAVVERLR